MSNEYRNFLALSYDELEELICKPKPDAPIALRLMRVREKRLKYLTDEKADQGCNRSLY